MTEGPLEHHRRHPRSFLDVSGRPEEPALAYRVWCLDCEYERALTEEQADSLADAGLPWRTGTE